MSYLSLLEYLNNGKIEYYIDTQASDLVSIKIGGLVSLVVYPRSTAELINIVKLVKGQRYFILGNGTNCYFSSQSYDGVVIVTKNINDIKIQGNQICADCGVGLCALCNAALNQSLSGMEFSYGIPATLGGAVYMNASAFGCSISNLVLQSTAYDVEGDRVVTLNREEHLFSVKNSVFRSKNLVHLNSELLLKQGEKAEILRKMQDFLQNRRKNQPLSLPSAGSVFINPTNNYASKMIDDCGLKGFKVGGAQVSTKHAGFIVNCGGATSHDVNKLIRIIKKRVFEKFNIVLNQEIIYVE